MNLSHNPHPIQKRFVLGSEGMSLVLLCDDIEDKPGKGQESKNVQTYYQWHSLLIPGWMLVDIEKKWAAIKSKYNIPDNYLHCRDKKTSKIILNKDIQIRSDIHRLIMDYHSVEHYITAISRNYFEAFKKEKKGTEKYKDIKRFWNLDDPKEQSLFFHLIILDEHMPDFHYQPEGYLFCDQTFSSHINVKVFQTLPGLGWYKCDHGYLDYIDNGISFRVHEIPLDPIGNCLDLVDYLAWSHQRVFRGMRVRDFGFGGPDLTGEEWERRINNLPTAEKELACYVKEMIETKKTRYLHPKGQ